MHINPLLDRSKLILVLSKVLDKVVFDLSNEDYRLVGTSAALLHGVELPVGDIDILVKERRLVDLFSKALSCFNCVIPPTIIPDMNQYYTEYSIDKVEVGISTVEIHTDKDWIETYGNGPWIHYNLLPCGSYIVPSVKLELRLITELYRKRPERYDPILDYMRIHGYDKELVNQGIMNLDIDEETYRRLNL
jgi:hypothetical protein